MRASKRLTNMPTNSPVPTPPAGEKKGPSYLRPEPQLVCMIEASCFCQPSLSQTCKCSQNTQTSLNSLLSDSSVFLCSSRLNGGRVACTGSLLSPLISLLWLCSHCTIKLLPPATRESNGFLPSNGPSQVLALFGRSVLTFGTGEPFLPKNSRPQCF